MTGRTSKWLESEQMKIWAHKRVLVNYRTGARRMFGLSR